MKINIFVLIGVCAVIVQGKSLEEQKLKLKRDLLLKALSHVNGKDAKRFLDWFGQENHHFQPGPSKQDQLIAEIQQLLLALADTLNGFVEYTTPMAETSTEIETVTMGPYETSSCGYWCQLFKAYTTTGSGSTSFAEHTTETTESTPVTTAPPSTSTTECDFLCWLKTFTSGQETSESTTSSTTHTEEPVETTIPSMTTTPWCFFCGWWTTATEATEVPAMKRKKALLPSQLLRLLEEKVGKIEH